MKLSSNKCTFGVELGKFLRFIVNHREIEANPKKIKVLLEMKSLRKVKDIQSLIGRGTAFSRFISKAID